MHRSYAYIYGPVPSWRLGSSLGIDPISGRQKICTFDCVYCQLGRTRSFSLKREPFVPVRAVMKEIASLPAVPIDYITFSGAGEPTLASNLGAMIRAVKKTRKEKVAVITNASLLFRKDVKKDLSYADAVLAKLDGYDARTVGEVNRPMSPITFERIWKGLKCFRREYHGVLALQVMFIVGTVPFARQIARLAAELGADEIQLNTPLRPCMVKPISKKDMAGVKRVFRKECDRHVRILSVYDAVKKNVRPISSADTLKRRGKV